MTNPSNFRTRIEDLLTELIAHDHNEVITAKEHVQLFKLQPLVIEATEAIISAFEELMDKPRRKDHSDRYMKGWHDFEAELRQALRSEK